MEVKDVMTRDVHCVAPETLLHEVADVLVEHGISGVPVCDADGAVVGVVSEADILFKERGPELRRRGFLSALAVGLRSEEDAKVAARTAGEAMTRPALTITPYRPVAAAAQLMLEHRVNRLPVVRRGELVGIVTRADLVRAFRRTDDEIAREIRSDVIEELLWLEPHVVDLTVSDGEVVLGGQLEQRSDADLLAKLVARVPGVVAVESRLTWRVDDTGRRGIMASSV
jgi:CBS domain-containing protein